MTNHGEGDGPLGLGKALSALALDAKALSQEERLELHVLLDRVLDRREAFYQLCAQFNFLGGLGQVALPNPEADKAAASAFDAAISLVARALGPVTARMLPSLGSEPRGARAILWVWLTRLRRLFPTTPGMFGAMSTITLEELLHELEDLDLGDQGTIFAPRQRKAGQKPKQGKLARLRLRALAWERFLRSQGDRPGAAQAKVSSAYGESWNTIEKWKKRVCVPLLGEWRVNFELGWADRGEQPTIRLLGDALVADGAEYRATLRENAAKARTA
jgi:hypothetical protein